MFRKYLIIVVLVLSALISACAPRGKASPDQEPPVEYFQHHVSLKGETLALIARWYTGDADNWNEILAHNPGIDVRKIKLGQVILIPRKMLIRETKLSPKAISGDGKRNLGNNNSGNADTAKPSGSVPANSAVTTTTATTSTPAQDAPIPDQSDSRMPIKKEPHTTSTAPDATATPISQGSVTPNKPATSTPTNNRVQEGSKSKTRYDLLKELLEQKQ